MMRCIRESLRGTALAVLVALPTVASAAGAEGGEQSGGLPQLDFATFPTQIFWLIVSFTVLYVMMSRVAVPRIAEVLEERQERIADDLETADRLREEAQKVREEYERNLADTHSEASSLIRATQDEIAKEQSDAEAEAAKKLARKAKTAETRIAKQKSEALESLKAVASEAALEATRKLIGVEADQAAVGKAVDAALAEGAS